MKINMKETERMSHLNHSCAHLLAQAVNRLYKNAKFWVGPVIEDGFYYDMDLNGEVIKEEDLPKIEAEMKKIVKEKYDIVGQKLTKEEALEKFKNDEYKIDLINNLPEDEQITCYKQGEFVDLCRGGHVENVKELRFFKLLKVSGAYWKGDSSNKMLQRVYGICFDDKKDLKDYLVFLEEAKKRDHKKLGRELDIFMMSEYGPGFPFLLNNGMIIRNELENFWHEVHDRADYKIIRTPMMLSKELWEKSGHWDNYKENMYLSEIDDKKYAVKPMNCPGAMLTFKNTLHSYKEFPLRLAELGLCHRHELSGALNGLFRVRNFTQDDAHIFVTEEQIKDEVVRILDIVREMYKVFGLDFSIELSTRPEKKYIGTLEDWERSENALKDACKKFGKDYVINEGDGAFYGPKLDIHINDSLGRTWQCGTIQLDVNLPERFDLSYVDHDGEKKRPVVIHRVVYGSIERFMGILIEHYAGVFPMWLAPVQINVIPVSSEYHLEYATQVHNELKEAGFRVKLDDRNEKLSYKMRESQKSKAPLTLIIGDNEKEENSVSYRRHGEKATTMIKTKDFINAIKKVIDNKEMNI